MASDNKVSSIIVLVLLGFAIYYLLNNEGFNPISKLTDNLHETFNDNNSEEVVVETPVPVMQQVQQVVPPSENQEPYVPQSVINDIAVGQQTQTPTPTQTGVFTFEPHDDSDAGGYGSNLDDAFALPLPTSMQTDTVDFKKENVDNFNAKDFLPREINDEWFETDFSLAKYQLNDDKLINSERYIIGINTVGQSLKNGSWDIRGTIANPKFNTGPWNNSTYEPDFNLKPLC